MNDSIPPPPPGFSLVEQAVPPPPPGFTLLSDQPERPSFGRRVLDTATGAAQGLRNFTRAAQGGQLLGWRDELQAAANSAMPGGGTYRENLASERAAEREFQQRNPVTAGAATLIGGMVSPAMAIPGGGATTMPGRIAQGAAIGGAAGGVAGAGEAVGGFDETAAGAGLGAATGAAFGAALPPIIQGGATAGRWVGERLGLVSPQTAGQRLILRDMDRSGVTPQNLVERASQGGKPEMIADLAGENALQSAQVIARSPGRGRQIAADNLAGRTGAAQSERLAGDVRRFVSNLDYRQEMPALLDQRSVEARPLYERAWQTRVPRTITEQLEPLTSGQIGQQALGRGLRVMEEEGRAAYLASVRENAPNPSLLFNPETVGAVRGPDGNWTIQGRMESLRLFDAVKRGLDEIAMEARNPTTGRPTQFGLMIERQRSELVNLLRERFPRYAEALDAWAGPSALMDAMRTGRGLLSEGAEAAERTAAEIQRMSPSEREFFRVGVARGLMDRINSTVDGAEQTRLNRIFASEGVRERLRAAFNSDDEFRAFSDAMERELRIANTNRTIAPNGGSPTMPMTEKANDLRSPPSGPVASALGAPADAPPREGWVDIWGRSGNMLPPVGVAVRNARDAMRENAYRRNTEVMAPILFTTDPVQRETAARGLLAQALRDEELAQNLAPLFQGLLRGAPAAAGLLANPD